MKNGEFLQMLNGIDEKYIDSAGRELYGSCVCRSICGADKHR